jgi:zinc protease
MGGTAPDDRPPLTGFRQSGGVPIDYRKPARACDGPAGRLVRSVHAPTSGAAYGALTFRVGTADESVPVRGITHLVEHLVMREAHHVDLRCNAGVDLVRTTFWAVGEPDDVAGFLRRVGAALLRLPVQHLASERDLIAVEEEHHPVSLPSPVQHFGAQRYGVVHFEQRVADLGAEQLTAWVRERFTADDAVLALAGVEPHRVPLRLPPGRFHPEPPVHRRREGPVLHVDPAEKTITLTALTPAAWAVAVLVGVLDRAVMNRLRHVEHLAYGAGAREVRVNSTTTMVSITSDCVPGREQQLVEALLDELDRLTRDLDDDLVLRSMRRVLDEAGEAPAVAELTERALHVLHGCPPPASSATLEAELDAVTTASLQGLLRDLLADCVLRTPVPVRPPGAWRADGDLPVEPWSGGRTFPALDGVRRLTASARGLQEGARQLTWSSIAAAFVTDEQWTLVSRRGARLDVRPDDWHEGAELLATLQDLVPSAVRVPGPWRRAR